MKLELTSKATNERKVFDTAMAASQFINRKKSYVSAAMTHGTRITNGKTGEEYTARYIMEAGRSTKDHYDVQLCCYCGNFAGGCEWSERFEPVPGWDAEPTIRSNGAQKPIHSYKIKSCPKFKEG